MSNPNGSLEQGSGINTEPTVLDIYFAETAKGPEHCLGRAMHVWDTLPPADRLALQGTARKVAGDNLALGAAYTRSILLLEAVNRQALAELVTIPTAE